VLLLFLKTNFEHFFTMGKVGTRDSTVSELVPAVKRAMRSLDIPRPLLDEAYSAGLIGAWKAVESFDPARSDNLEAFAYMKARYYIKDEIRLRLRQGGTFNGSFASLDALTPEEATPASLTPDPAKTAELLDSYRHFLRRCTPKQVQVHRLRTMGYTSQEIADRLGVTYSAVYYRLRESTHLNEQPDSSSRCD